LSTSKTSVVGFKRQSLKRSVATGAKTPVVSRMRTSGVSIH